MDQVCIVCGIPKPIKHFVSCRANLNGHKSTCRQCAAIGRREWYKKNADKRRKWSKENAARYTKRKRQKRKETPEGSARNILQKAVKRGKIAKPQHCQECGLPKESKQLHGHHKDYSKPLEVVWLYAACHLKLHRTYGEAA